MESASNFAYCKKAPAKKPISIQNRNQIVEREEEEELDTNVISLKFKNLKQAEENIQMGDPYFCRQCKSCLSSASKILSEAQYRLKYPLMKKKEEEKKEEDPKPNHTKPIMTARKPSIKNTKKMWVCEFCGEHNTLNIDSEEIPKSDDVIFLLKSAQQMSKDPSDLASDTTTIFCIDNSGSMGVTSEIKGEHDLRHGLSEEEYEMLKQFIENGADQYLPNQTRGTTFISRKQCVLAAIEEQLMTLKDECPNRKVGLVTFDNEVNVIGDGKGLPETIAGDKLYKYDELRNIGQALGDQVMKASVKDSAEDLVKKFEKLKEAGKTALGPALLISLGLAMKGKQGSRVILCTDGLANIGLGEMDTPEKVVEARDFYSQIGMFAKENGVSISVISIKGEGCKLNVLSNVAVKTSGSITKVDPEEITKKFKNIMKNEVLGTQAEVRLRLHQAMKFRNESSEVLQEKESLYQNEIGNVTGRTVLTFEYQMRSESELKNLKLNSAKLESIPFQAQIMYTSNNGDRLMRVITKTLKVTHDLEVAEKSVNVKVLATRALHKQGEMASKQSYGDSNKVADKWGKYINERVGHFADSAGKQVLDRYKNNNQILRKATARKEMKQVQRIYSNKKYQPREAEEEEEDEDEDVVLRVKRYNFDCEEE